MKLIFTLASIFVATQLFASSFEVKGRVLSLSGSPIGGVNVIVKGSAQGTATDMMGSFKLQLPEGKSVILFQYLRRKPVEHAILIEPGFEYQISVTLATTSQTFNKSGAVIASIPLGSPQFSGIITDQDNKPLQGVRIFQENHLFSAVTNAKGYFSLPLRVGSNVIHINAGGMKPFQYSIAADHGYKYFAEIVLVEDAARYRRQQSTAKSVHSELILKH